MLLTQLKEYSIYLVSQSPRRQELLKGMGIEFDSFSSDVEEIYPTHFSPVEVAEYLAQLKLSEIQFSKYPEKSIFIACDTIVVLGNEIIGKPSDKEEAREMLRKLAGHTHTVISGLSVATSQVRLSGNRQTQVHFASFSEEEIEYYISKYLPLDKAGSYGVQEWIGYIGIESIEGSFYNVMGLPTKLLWDLLHQICNPI